MSQNKVYMALKEIGGEGTTTEIRERLSEKFPNSTLPHYAVHQLRNLEKKGIVEIDDDVSPFYVRITNHNWEGIQHSLAHRESKIRSEND